jgi:hypothetical protein
MRAFHFQILTTMQADPLSTIDTGSPQDEAVSQANQVRRFSADFRTGKLDRPGRFGCMSCDSLYNVVHLSDPIA